MLEIRSTKYARQLNLTFFGKRYEDVPRRLVDSDSVGEKAQKNASMSARPLPLTCHNLYPLPSKPLSLLSCKSDSFTSSKISFFSNGQTPNGLIVAIDWGIQNSSPPDNVACVRFGGNRFSELPATCVQTERKRETIDSTNFFNE